MLEQYFEDIADATGLSTDEEYVLYTRIQQGDHDARNALVRANLRFVVQVARQYVRSGVPLEDLISAGNIGLIHAAEKFDATRKYRFITYAVAWIRSHIQMAVIEQRNTVRIPQNQSVAIHRLHRLRDELEQKAARTVRFDVAAETSDMKLDVATDVLRSERTPHSLDSPLPNTEIALRDTIPSPTVQADSICVEGSLQHLLECALDQLSPRQGRIVRWYFGTDGRPAATLAEIGAAEGISRERVRQIIARALTSLRRKAPQLREFV
tara:strand:+ start:1577 stop:2377 length:801 start_codon:yes stop_codon:yes gene_type:complete